MTGNYENDAWFRAVNDYAVKNGFLTGFPNFHQANYGNGVVYGLILVKNNVGAIFQDVPQTSYGINDRTQVGAMMRAANDYAAQNGYVGAFPTFHQADYGNGVVYGTILLSKEAVEFRDVKKVELNVFNRDDIGAMMRAANDYAYKNGFSAGIPTFHHDTLSHDGVYGIVLFKPGTTEWQDLPAEKLKKGSTDGELFLKVATFNVHGFSTDSGEFPTYSRVADEIKKHEIQVLFLQEGIRLQAGVDANSAFSKFVSELSKKTQRQWFYEIAHDSKGEKIGHGIVSQFPLYNVQSHLVPKVWRPIPSTNHDTSVLDATINHVIPIRLLSAALAPDTNRLITGTIFRIPERKKGIKVMMDIAKFHSGYMIAGGDFNASESSEEMQHILDQNQLGSFRSSYRETKSAPIGPCIPYKDKDPIDYILVRGFSTLTYITDHCGPPGTRLSDHGLIVTYLKGESPEPDFPEACKPIQTQINSLESKIENLQEELQRAPTNRKGEIMAEIKELQSERKGKQVELDKCVEENTKPHTEPHGWSGWENLGGVDSKLNSNVAAVSPSPERIDVFALGTDNSLYHKWYFPGNGWSGWENLGGVDSKLNSNVAAVSPSPERIDVFALGTDNSLYHKWYFPGNGWSGWENLGGSLKFGPGACSFIEKRIDVFALGTDNSLYHKWYFPGLGSFPEACKPIQTQINSLESKIENLQEELQRAPTNRKGEIMAEIKELQSERKGKQVELDKCVEENKNNWTGWENLGGVDSKLSSNVAAVSPSPERIDVFALGTDNSLYHKWYFPGNGWSGWENLGGVDSKLNSNVAAVSPSPERIDVFALGTDNSLYHKWYFPGNGWSGWENLGGSLKFGPGACSFIEKRIDVFALGTDNSLYHKWNY